jgi:hypothetical protein
MFKCQITGKMSRPGEKANKIIVETRPKTYYGWFLNEETGKMEHHEVARGWEIVKEVNATDEGLRIWKEMQDASK